MQPRPHQRQDAELAEPNPLYLRYQQIQADSACASHSHPWGQLSMISLGVMEIVLDEQRLLAPADYLIWVPAGLEHASYNQQALDYTSIYVNDSLAARLPTEPRLLEMTPLIRAMLADFCDRRLGHMEDEWDRRQAELLVEKLSRTRCQESYLPMSQDKLLAPMLAALRSDPSDPRTLAQWAEQLHSTERTLARRCVRELGMNFGQWRARLRLLKALAWLKGELPIQEIGWRLGYGSTSAFIAMFNRELGCSPQRYRQQLAQPGG
ncbi:helix-turn-helix transcriptional regulator [Aeromonas sp. sif2433]|uniref:AraC family transcriptional regulator n=1 Tax=Aeromonas sp. sif2433 TaxID=2854794 RepID=UPI001C43B2EE|nr:helix-turn-helix transcriptional regulator [Aeromonas sp. sif2433]MBV7414571.1 helix-turn-helix domain-containing protein [Aeromonas sp. sif2433]